VIDRRSFVRGAVVTVFAAPLAAEAEQTGKTPRIGFLGTATPSLMSAWLVAFREGLSERGYVEGQNIAIEYRWEMGSQSGLGASWQS